MKTVFIGTLAVLLFGCVGCVWPAATYVHGTATVSRPGLHQATSAAASQPDKPIRIIVVKYWSVQELFNSNRKKFEFFGAEVVDKTDFSVSFPLRFYTAGWTPVLGAQHLLPKAGLILFAEGYWPCHVVAGDGRRCCEAPATGERHWHAVLEPIGQPPTCSPPDKGWKEDEFPPLTLDELESVLRWNWSITAADREMCRRQLEQLLDYWRKNSSQTRP